MQRPRGARTDPVVQQSAGRGLADHLELDIVDPQSGTGTCRDLSGVDRQVASRSTGIDRVTEVGRAAVEQFPRLDGDVAVSGAVIAVADQTFARFGSDGVHRAGRDLASGGDVHSDYSHDATVYFG